MAPMPTVSNAVTEMNKSTTSRAGCIENKSRIRIKALAPFTVPAKKALTGIGASLYVSGTHECIGTTPIFVPRPISKKRLIKRIALLDMLPKLVMSSVP
jgi:hypothetical protein